MKVKISAILNTSTMTTQSTWPIIWFSAFYKGYKSLVFRFFVKFAKPVQNGFTAPIMNPLRPTFLIVRLWSKYHWVGTYYHLQG